VERFVINLGYRDEHSVSAKKRHEFDEHGTSFRDAGDDSHERHVGF
jgi:hypothetical protein